MVIYMNKQLGIVICLQVDAMKIGVKQFKKEYKDINVDKIEVSSRP